MAIIDKKQTRWYSKSTFDSLDKTTIPVGTEIQVAGEIEEADLTADLQTKINGKLTAPTTPTADSAVTLLANGTTGTKALSEFGGKLYAHELNINLKDANANSVNIRSLIYSSINTAANNSATLVGLLNGQHFPAWGYALNSNYFSSYFIESLYAENTYFRYTYVSLESNTEFSGGDMAESQCTEITITDTVTEI